MFSVLVAALPMDLVPIALLYFVFFAKPGKFSTTRTALTGRMIWVESWAIAGVCAFSVWYLQRNWLYLKAQTMKDSSVASLQQGGLSAAQALHYHHTERASFDRSEAMHDQFLWQIAVYITFFLVFPLVRHLGDRRRARAAALTL